MRIFILFSCAVAIYFGLRLSQEAYLYASLSERAPAKILRWEIEEAGSRFAVRAVYEFSCEGKILIGSSFSGPSRYLNDAAALSSIREEAKKNWAVYYDANHPGLSTLDRRFPKGYAIRFLISALISIYFFIIRKRFKSINN